jgi:Fic family protein
MDAELYVRMLSDKSIIDLKKLRYKYPDADIEEFTNILKSRVYKGLRIWDFNGNDAVFLENVVQVSMNAVKVLLTPQSSLSNFGVKAMEDEITSTLTIENIDFNRDSVRKILRGATPSDEQETRIYGMKKGLEFIADSTNTISEENIFALYDMSIGQYLDGENKLKSGEYYRHDMVHVIGQDIEHTGLPHAKLPIFMRNFIAFIREDSPMNDLLKAAVIHFYFCYLHPYFDGNGRMARLLHMWFLRQRNYSSALFVPLSSYIERSRKQYYAAYFLTEQNAKISGVIDVTPFLLYFIEHVYDKLASMPQPDILAMFNQAIESGHITIKEKELWNFTLSVYGNCEFSTKQLERDFGNAAYATIRGFALKFTEMGLLTSQKYGSRVKYAISTHTK